MPGALGKSLIKYFKKEEPNSKGNSLRDLGSFSTFGVAFAFQERKKAPEGSAMERACSWYSRSRVGPKRSLTPTWGDWAVLYWQRIRMHFFGVES